VSEPKEKSGTERGRFIMRREEYQKKIKKQHQKKEHEKKIKKTTNGLVSSSVESIYRPTT